MILKFIYIQWNYGILIKYFIQKKRVYVSVFCFERWISNDKYFGDYFIYLVAQDVVYAIELVLKAFCKYTFLKRSMVTQ